ncbi:hypothetical protein B0H11DRAFT_1987691 [Mycena galericulata]|nr:hypothetical protein B0H11DRAFT_1987691 [Mycena galericulata]
MHKRKGPGSHLKSSSQKSSNRVIPALSSKLLDIPPELWDIVGGFASRQSVARLCSVSHDFYATFAALLYSNTIDPPLTSAQSSHLIQTLAETPTVSWKPHPAALIQQLGLTDGGHFRKLETTNLAKMQSSINALNNICKLSLADRPNGSALRVLDWRVAAGLDELGKILGAPGQFSNLRELLVTSNGTNNNFNFISIGRLEVLGLTFNIDPDNDDICGDRLCYKLAEALQMLPSTSPILHTLQLNLKIPFDENTFPFLGYCDLVDAINWIHLPFLATLELSVDLHRNHIDHVEDDLDDIPNTDLLAFLSSHPNLLNLTFSAHGTDLTGGHTPLFPRLRSFKGSFEDSKAICGGGRQLETLTIALVHPCLSGTLPAFSVLQLPTNLSLTKLRVLAVDTVGSTLKITDEISPRTFSLLAASFPNLTHLDICLSGPMTEYHKYLTLLTKLQSLRLQEYRTRRKALKSSPVVKIFPPAEYKTQITRLLPFLPHLASTEICILADFIEQDEDSDSSCFECCGCCGESALINPEVLFSPPEMTATYFFSVTHLSGDTNVVLDKVRRKKIAASPNASQ